MASRCPECREAGCTGCSWAERVAELLNNPILYWRYLPDPAGTTVHAIEHLASGPALCGREPWGRVEWRGTGTQEEYEEVERRQHGWVCRNCVKAYRRPR